MTERDLSKTRETDLSPTPDAGGLSDSAHPDPKTHREVYKPDPHSSTRLVESQKLPALELSPAQQKAEHDKHADGCYPVNSAEAAKIKEQFTRTEIHRYESIQAAYSPDLKGLLAKHPEIDPIKNARQTVEQFQAQGHKLDSDSLQYSQRQTKHDIAQKNYLEEAKKAGLVGPGAQEALKHLPPEKAAEFKERGAALAKEQTQLGLMDAQVRKETLALQDMKSRIDLCEDLARIDKLPPSKRQEIYKSVDQMLDSHHPSFLSAADRQQVAHDVLHQIAHPEDIKQGHKPMCALASTEFFLAKQHPEVYARSMASIVRDGKLDGVKLPQQDYQNNDNWDKRTLASGLFQSTAADMVTSSYGGTYLNFKPGEAPKVSDGHGHMVTPVDDTGDRIRMSDGKLVPWHGVTGQEQADLLHRLTGQKYRVDREEVESPQQMQQKIETEAAKYGYPIKFDIAGHAITIVGLDKTTHPPNVIYDDTNQPRGVVAEHQPIDRFYNLMNPGPYIEKGVQLGAITIPPEFMRIPTPVGIPIDLAPKEATRYTEFIRPDSH